MLDKNKRAQIGEGITWIVATIVILVILIAGIYLASVVAGAKDILGLNKQAEFKGLPDRFAEKSLNSYLLTNTSNDVRVYDQIKKDGNLNDVTGPLAKNIFLGLYQKEGEYQEVWFGISNLKDNSFVQIKNNYFGSTYPNHLAFPNLKEASSLTFLSNSRELNQGVFIELFFKRFVRFE